MKIVVTYKWAANPQDASVAASGAVDFSRAKSALSEYDLQPIEIGRHLADQTGAELIGLSVGPVELAGSLAKKAALARGLDSVYLIAADELAHLPTTQTGLLLAEAIRQIGDVDLVLTGESSIDIGASMVPSVLAAALSWPVFSEVTAIDGQPGAWRIERTHGSDIQALTLVGPAVLSVAAAATTVRVPGMKDILAAGKKTAHVLDIGVPPVAAVQVLSVAKPEMVARKGVIVGGADPEQAASALIAALRADQSL